jgi:hypothetical protein
MTMPANRPAAIVVDASGLAPEAASIDLLARLRLAAGRLGRHLLVRGASADLERLISFAGLAGVLRLEARREAEQREEPLGAEEERQLPDQPV